MGAVVWILGLCCVIATGLQTIRADDSLPIVVRLHRTVVDNTNTNLNDSNESKKECKARGITCGSCTSVMLCNHENKMVASYECSSVDAQRPYCVGNGMCTNIMDAQCNTPSELCPPEQSYAFYPVPGNCSESVYCNDKKFAMKQSAPSSSYVFNSLVQSWTLRKTTADCFQINCLSSTMQNKFYVYKPNPRLYFYCATFGPMTFECSENEEFNETKRRCEFACKKEGKFAIPDGNGGSQTDRYYLCLAGLNGSYQLFETPCPTGLTFQTDDCKLPPPPATS
ncbi:uncharacterized protein LOC3291073 [Anopheles gambiae]|uniref:BPTI/Kunitz inhibitor domain-containing protein n=1 Tax=Anopheles coluzzii TaxID=1518534 RepID=A0A6E8W2B8_ANOCL|nr:uncharacterized protein LOC120959492 [Anopheles coluzzii]XP_559095.2 uncharacterized protein LOC3291073 [Anopheles gambiae]